MSAHRIRIVTDTTAVLPKTILKRITLRMCADHSLWRGKPAGRIRAFLRRVHSPAQDVAAIAQDGARRRSAGKAFRKQLAEADTILALHLRPM